MNVYQFNVHFQTHSINVSLTGINQLEAFHRIEELYKNEPNFLAVIPSFKEA
jgi:hypothetical protein